MQDSKVLLRQIATDMDFAIAAEGISMAEAARRASLAPATVYRLMNCLKPRKRADRKMQDCKLSTLLKLGTGIDIEISVVNGQPKYRRIKRDK